MRVGETACRKRRAAEAEHVSKSLCTRDADEALRRFKCAIVDMSLSADNLLEVELWLSRQLRDLRELQERVTKSREYFCSYIA